MKKIKVVWICQFIKKDFLKHLNAKKVYYEMHPWIPLGINEMKKRDDIELHVVAPFPMAKKDTVIKEKNITYHCLNSGIPFIEKGWPSYFRLDFLTDYYCIKKKIKRVVNKIKPDIINLHGAENPRYSSSILQFKNKYPVLVTIQGFVSLENVINPDSNMRKRLYYEKKILSDFNTFCIEARFMGEHIKNFNESPKLYFAHYPISNNFKDNNTDKIYDIVFFARIEKNKGIEDLLQSMPIIKNKYPDVKLLLCGKGYPEYIEKLKLFISENGLENNVVFKGFFPTQEELHKEVSKSKISVLPTYNDTIPGTIIESMFLGIPSISYETGGVPDLNQDDENLIIVEQGNTKKLTEKIIYLLDNPEKQKMLSEKAKKYALDEFDNSKSINKLVEIYNEILN